MVATALWYVDFGVLWELMNLALESDLNFLGFESQLCLPPIVDNTSMKHSLFASTIEMEVTVFQVLELSLPSSQGPFGTWVNRGEGECRECSI